MCLVTGPCREQEEGAVVSSGPGLSTTLRVFPWLIGVRLLLLLP